jgi:hypothetical protein
MESLSAVHNALCRVLDVSPSGYYASLVRSGSRHARRDEELLISSTTVLWSQPQFPNPVPRQIEAALLRAQPLASHGEARNGICAPGGLCRRAAGSDTTVRRIQEG